MRLMITSSSRISSSSNDGGVISDHEMIVVMINSTMYNNTDQCMIIVINGYYLRDVLMSSAMYPIMRNSSVNPARAMTSYHSHSTLKPRLVSSWLPVNEHSGLSGWIQVG